MLNPKSRLMTIDEFFETYGSTDQKWELIDGEAWAMSGAARGHNQVAGNIFFALRTRLSGHGYQTFGSDMGLRLDAANVRFPDVGIYCDPRDLGTDKAHSWVLQYPKVVMEILSPSTAQYDRGGKAAEYRALPSMAAIVLVDWERRRIHVHERGAEGWSVRIVIDDEPLVLADPDLTLTAAEIYAGL